MNEKEKLEGIRTIIKEWADKKGHERCWYYPELFNKLTSSLNIEAPDDKKLPSLEEFKCGCEKYQREEYGTNTEDRVTKEKIDKYRKLTQNALKIAKNSIEKDKEKEAEEIIKMVENYLSDSEYFQQKEDFVDAFAALNYAHGWIDSGVRLGIFDVKDDKLFTIK